MDKRKLSSIILKYWYFLEFLGQSDFPAQDRLGKDECKKAAKGYSKRKQISVFNNLNCNCVFDEIEDNSFQMPADILDFNNTVYMQHIAVSDENQICIGKIERAVFAEKLREICAPELEFPENNRHKVGLIGLKCDSEGCYIPGSLNISPLLWGINRIIKHKNEDSFADLLSIDDYKYDMEHLEQTLLTENDGKAEGELLTQSLLKRLINQTYQEYLSIICAPINSVCWDGVLVSQRYKTEEIKADDAETYREGELFRSFFAADISMVSETVTDNKFGGTPMQSAILDYICTPYFEEEPQFCGSDNTNRVNVFGWNEQNFSKQMDFFHEHMNITRAPHGKWPSRYNPGFMQQLAINSSWNPLCDNQTIFSVNGPPGTGKTTLLKEIIAGNVVERAYLLTQYRMPDDAFTEKHFCDGLEKNNGYSRFCNAYFAFKNDAIKDYGMLVASCNNAAVENITKDLPDANKLLKGIGAEEDDDSGIAQGLKEVSDLYSIESAETEVYQTWNSDLSKYESCAVPDIYFTKLANDLVEKPTEKWDRWGLISAPFGKASNLKNYIYRVLKPYIKSFGRNDFIESKREEYPNAAKRFSEQYKKVKLLESELKIFSGAWAEYLERKGELENKIKNAKTQLNSAQKEESSFPREIEQLEQSLISTNNELKKCRETACELQRRMISEQIEESRLKTEVEGIEKQIIDLEHSRRFSDYVFAFFGRPTMLSEQIREKYSVLETVKQSLNNQKTITKKAEESYKEQQKLCLRHENEICRLNTDKQRLEIRQKQNIEKQKELREAIEKYLNQINTEFDNYKTLLSSVNETDSAHKLTVLDEEFFRLYNSKNNEESCKAQNLNPWITAEYNREREKLFFEALRLHKAFLLGSKCCLWNFKNLLLFWNEPRDDDEKPVNISKRDREVVFGELLNTIFLLTPVISTTFASAGTMLSSIRNTDEIGCLIVDEAGQASPHMAIGALFRSRRAIIVGDPKQVEPVVTDELDLIKRIMRDDITRCYQDKRLSVQGFADKLNKIGTYYTDGPEDLWVGCPLVVHRRCISPMFDISNAISYNHIMKQQTALPPPEKENTFCKEKSGWFNVCGSEKSTVGKDHFVETQGKKAWEMILSAFRKTDGIPSLFVITPFTTVRDGLKKMITEQPEYKQDNRIRDWAENHIGTVHTFQGKEADQVIFLLGCDKKSVSAVKWVNTNIVNVAVTRAKYRLYVIADYLVWRESVIFQRVKGILDSYAIKTLYEFTKKPSDTVDESQVENLLKQIPDADSLTVDGIIDERLLLPLTDELTSMLRNADLKPEHWRAFGLSGDDVEKLPADIRKRLTVCILQHGIIATVKKRYQIEMNDASGTGILFCKVMETLLKQQLFEKFKAYFSVSEPSKFSELPCDNATLGTFTHILNNVFYRNILAEKKVSLAGSLCDLDWWDTYAVQLDSFRELRNHCCHSEPFEWEQYEQMLKILFSKREFMNTFVGEILP